MYMKVERREKGKERNWERRRLQGTDREKRSEMEKGRKDEIERERETDMTTDIIKRIK